MVEGARLESVCTLIAYTWVRQIGRIADLDAEGAPKGRGPGWPESIPPSLKIIPINCPIHNQIQSA